MIAAGEAFLSIDEWGRRLRAGTVTALELTEFFLARLKSIGSAHNAVVTLTEERAREEARLADDELRQGIDRGPLHGIPYGAKDLLATRGIPTTWGAAPFREQVFPDDATVIQRLRAAGAVLTAKLAMIELAGGFGYRQANASFTGPALNAWDLSRWGGGSSSGSGIALGAGLVPFAIGSETSGSILNPAGTNGITGFRPTYGLVPRTGAMALSWTLDKIGPLCRTARDCRTVLRAIAGPDREDFTTFEVGATLDAPTALPVPCRMARIAGCLRSVQPEIAERFEAACTVLGQFGTLDEIELPDLPYSAVVGTIITGEMAAAFEDFIRSGQVQELTAPEDRWGGYAGLVLPAKDYINALRVRRKIQVALDAVCERYEVLLAPALATVAGPIDRDFREWSRGFASSSLGVAGNAGGLPGITVPMGPGADGLPTGLQLVSGARRDGLLLSIAMEFQQRTDWHRQHPERYQS